MNTQQLSYYLRWHGHPDTAKGPLHLSRPTLLLPQLSFYPHSTSVELESSWLIWAISRLAATYILLPTPSFLHSCFLLPTSYFLLPTSYSVDLAHLGDEQVDEDDRHHKDVAPVGGGEQ